MMPDPTPASSERPRILVVDDEPSILRFASKALELGGYAVDTAPNGAEALRFIEATGCADLFVVDVAMPDINGTELARLIRAAHPRATVLYFTGYSDQLFDEKRTLWTDEAFLDKPADMPAPMLLFGDTRGPQDSAAP